MTVISTTTTPAPYCLPLALYDERYHIIVSGPYAANDCDNNCPETTSLPSVPGFGD